MLFMSEKFKGTFSASLLSLQLQLKTLLEDAGGDTAVEFLNAVSSLHESEQKVVLETFTNIVNKIVNGEKRLVTEGDLARKEFEDNLFDDIIEAMQDAAKTACVKKLTVVDGGKTPKMPEKAPISLCEARKTKKISNKPLLN